MADLTELVVGHYLDYSPNTSGANTYVLDAANKSLEFNFPAEVQEPIVAVWVRPGNINGTSPVYRVSLQGIGGDGYADGTTKASGGATATFTPVANTPQWVTLGTPYTPTIPEILANVISYASGTIDAGNSAAFVRGFGGSVNPHVGYSSTNVGGSKTKFGQAPTILGYRTASQIFGFPIANAPSVAFSNSVEIAAKVTLPANFGYSCKLLGAEFYQERMANGVFTVRVYQGGAVGGTTAVATSTADSDLSVAFAERPWPYRFPSPPTIYFGQPFRVSIAGDLATNVNVRTIEVASADDWQAFPLGSGLTWSQRSGGDWTDTPTRRPIVKLYLGAITQPAGGGGVSRSRLVNAGGV